MNADQTYTHATFPIDFGDDDRVVNELLRAGALESYQQYEGPQNRHAIAELGSKFKYVMSGLINGIMEDGTRKTTHVKAKPPAVNMKSKPKPKPEPIVFYNPQCEYNEDIQIKF